MKRKFPEDIVFLIVGPFLMAFIALGLSSLIYHATDWDRESVISGTQGETIVLVLALRAYLKRRQQHGDVQSSNTRDESNPNI